MSKQSIVQVTLKANEELIKRTKQQQRRSFYMVGKERWVNLSTDGDKPDWQYEGIDFIDAFAAMSKREQAVTKLIKDCIKWNKELNSFDYLVELSPTSVHFNESVTDSMPYNTFLKGFQLLFKKDLVRRIKRNHYMFNPDFFIPSGEQAKYFELLWTESKSCK
jgi:hypothetical protein